MPMLFQPVLLLRHIRAWCSLRKAIDEQHKRRGKNFAASLLVVCLHLPGDRGKKLGSLAG
jgi:hypothetical protein